MHLKIPLTFLTTASSAGVCYITSKYLSLSPSRQHSLFLVTWSISGHQCPCFPSQILLHSISKGTFSYQTQNDSNIETSLLLFVCWRKIKYSAWLSDCSACSWTFLLSLSCTTILIPPGYDITPRHSFPCAWFGIHWPPLIQQVFDESHHEMESSVLGRGTLSPVPGNCKEKQSNTLYFAQWWGREKSEDWIIAKDG